MEVFQNDAFQFDPLAFQQSGDAALNFAFQMCAFDFGGFQADVCTTPPEPSVTFEDYLLRAHRHGRR